MLTQKSLNLQSLIKLPKHFTPTNQLKDGLSLKQRPLSAAPQHHNMPQLFTD